MTDKTRPSRTRTAFTLVLMFVWLILLTFAFVAASDPPWLRNLAKLGRTGESKSAKESGDDFLRQNKYQYAIASYRRALEIKPDYIEALTNLAAAYDFSGDSKQGLKILQEALKKPSDRTSTIYLGMAKIYDRQGDKDQAIQYYLRALGGEADEGFIYFRIGAIYYDQNKYENAAAALEKALQIQTDPRTPYRKMIVSSIPRFENDTTDLNVLQRMLKEDTSANSYKDYDLETFKMIQESNPEIAKIHNFLGVINGKLGFIESAQSHFQRSLQIWPGNTDARNNLQLIQQMKNKAVQAENIKNSQ